MPTATITVTYSVDTTTEADASVDNTADATSDDGGSDSSTDDVAIVENVVLDATKTFNSATVTAGGADQTFTITVKNNGVSQADNVNVADLVDSRLEVSDVSSSEFTCAPAAQAIDCDLVALNAGETATITVTYSVDTTTEADASVDNTADATSDDGGSDSSTDDVAIVENVVLDVTKTFNSATVTAGGADQTFTITVKNNGVSQADNVNVADLVDSRLEVSDVSSSEFTCAPAAQAIDCDLVARTLVPRPRSRHLFRRHDDRGRRVR